MVVSMSAEMRAPTSSSTTSQFTVPVLETVWTGFEPPPRGIPPWTVATIAAMILSAPPRRGVAKQSRRKKSWKGGTWDEGREVRGGERTNL